MTLKEFIEKYQKVVQLFQQTCLEKESDDLDLFFIYLNEGKYMIHDDLNKTVNFHNMDFHDWVSELDLFINDHVNINNI